MYRLMAALVCQSIERKAFTEQKYAITNANTWHKILLSLSIRLDMHEFWLRRTDNSKRTTMNGNTFILYTYNGMDGLRRKMGVSEHFTRSHPHARSSTSVVQYNIFIVWRGWYSKLLTIAVAYAVYTSIMRTSWYLLYDCKLLRHRTVLDASCSWSLHMWVSACVCSPSLYVELSPTRHTWTNFLKSKTSHHETSHISVRVLFELGCVLVETAQCTTAQSAAT